jgi:hypothetical protein
MANAFSWTTKGSGSDKVLAPFLPKTQATYNQSFAATYGPIGSYFTAIMGTQTIVRARTVTIFIPTWQTEDLGMGMLLRFANFSDFITSTASWGDWEDPAPMEAGITLTTVQSTATGYVICLGVA